MSTMKTEYILCAAIRRVCPRTTENPYFDSDINDVELGYRHCDIYRRFPASASKDPKDQGFYTSRNRFVGRNEAFLIAYHANQIPASLYDERGKEGKLYSEDLY